MALESVRSELSTLHDDELLPLNLDPLGVVETVLGVWPGLLAMRRELAALPGFDLGAFDRLPQYAGALAVAHGLWKGAAVPKSMIGTMAKELMAIRHRLYVNASALALDGIIDGERLAQVKTQRGHRPLATDVLTLVLLFKEHWHVIAGRTSIGVVELHDASQLVVKLLTAVGVRDTAPVRLSEAARQRRRVYTLLLRSYEAVRRAVEYLRPESGAARKIAPSLYGKRRARRRRQQQQQRDQEPLNAAAPTADALEPTTAG